jgi:hypothetical protein
MTGTWRQGQVNRRIEFLSDDVEEDPTFRNYKASRQSGTFFLLPPPSSISTSHPPNTFLKLELHLYLPQPTLLTYLSTHSILPCAFSPLGSTNSPLISDPTVIRIAGERGMAVAEVLLGWLSEFFNFLSSLFDRPKANVPNPVSKQIIPLPRSTSPTHINANINALNTLQLLTQQDLRALDEVAGKEGKGRRLVKPPWRECSSFPFCRDEYTYLLVGTKLWILDSKIGSRVFSWMINKRNELGGEWVGCVTEGRQRGGKGMSTFFEVTPYMYMIPIPWYT